MIYFPLLHFKYCLRSKHAYRLWINVKMLKVSTAEYSGITLILSFLIYNSLHIFYFISLYNIIATASFRKFCHFYENYVRNNLFQTNGFETN